MSIFMKTLVVADHVNESNDVKCAFTNRLNPPENRAYQKGAAH